MNNSTAPVNSISNATALAEELAQQAYLDHIVKLCNSSILALLVYTMILAIPQEMTYMWLSPKPFGIPNLLYTFARYASLIYQALYLWAQFVPPLGSLCNDLINVSNAANILTYIGVQGLLITRAYSLCEGNKVIAGALAFFFMGGLILNLSASILFTGCFENDTAKLLLILVAEIICAILVDSFVFAVCLWKVWGTWKLKREIGIQCNNDLVSMLLKQIVSRVCFVIIFTITGAILDLLSIFIPRLKNGLAINVLGNFEHSLSAILLADFTLDLRQQNSATIQATNIPLPSIRFQSVANYIHQSILVEMGDHENTNASEVDDNDPSGSLDVEIRGEESAQDHT